jgi:Protein of unknown function (DUF998)
MDRRDLAGWAGMIGSALFVTVFTIEGWLRPGYDAVATFVSELSLGTRGWIQSVNFLVLGVLFLVFTQGVRAEFRDGKASRAGPILLGIIGMSLFASGIFVTDPATTPRDQVSVEGRVHQVFGALVFLFMSITPFVFFRRFRTDPYWRPFQWWTVAAGFMVTAAVVLLRVGRTLPPGAPNAFNGWQGLIQRAALIPYLAWIFAFAMRLRERSR